jgi:hypothetical protein
VTEPPADGALTVSVNFWFAATSMLLRPTVPLSPAMVVELARQLEYLVTDCLADCARHVPAFFAALLATLDAAEERAARACVAGRRRDLGCVGEAAREVAQTSRPPDVPPAVWRGLLEFVPWKLALLVGAAHMRAFAVDLCHPSRFERLQF